MNKRRRLDEAAVALVNKMVRVIWMLLIHDPPYQRGYVILRDAPVLG